ncbi:c-type cytochrome [Melaminivora suipulveris]
MNNKTSLTLALACSALMLAACGKNDNTSPTAPPPLSQAPAPAPAEPAPVPAEPMASAPTAPGTTDAAAGSSSATGTSAATGASDASAVSAPSASASAAVAGGATVAQAGGDGKSVYDKTCALCHAAGVAGAPKPGDKGDWSPRIAQGNDTLYKHAIEGFTGKKGVMPPRGGAVNLSDDEVKSAVDYMVSQSS